MSNFIKNYYSSIDQTEKAHLRIYDEGPLVRKKYVSKNIVGISTSQIDQFRQGVEITQEKFAVGMVKISAGTAGHIIKPNSYGVNDLDIISEDKYFEVEYFNPIRYLSVGGINGKNIEKLFTFPIITSDENQAENRSLNGIIEPITIRSVASFFSIEFPYESHAVRGCVMGGNSDKRFFSSDQILTVDYYPDLINEDYYLDAFETTAIEADNGNQSVPIQTVGYVTEKLDHVNPYDDTREYLKNTGILAKTHGQDMVNAIKAMVESTWDYIPKNKKSGTTGFVYDNIGGAGTDSIAYGGLTY